MSSEATGWVLRHGPKDRAMRYVLLTIAECCNRDGEHSHPGMGAIIEGSLYTRAHVYRTLDRLIKEGWLTVEDEGGGRGKATVYAIPGVRGARTRNRPTVGIEDQGNRPIRPAKPSHPVAETVPSEGASLCSATVGINQPPNPSVASAPSLAENSAASTAFEAFWTAYPTRNGKRLGRRDAERSWRNLSRAQQHAALVAVAHYRDACDSGLTIAKDAHRWLAKHWWDDWQTPAEHTTPVRTNGSRSAWLDRPGKAPLKERLAEMLNGQPDQLAIGGEK